jgi:regulator of sigma E protease
MGVRSGDTLGGIEGAQDVLIVTQADLDKALRANVNKQVTLIVTRKGEDVPLKGVIPPAVLATPPTVRSWTVAGLYFEPGSTSERVSFRKSVMLGNFALKTIFRGLWHLLAVHKLQQNAGGIVRMYQQTHIAAKAGISELISLAAQISISLAIFNMFPIPVLDGGHLLSFFVEWDAFLVFGLAVIGVLVILINGHDFIQKITHQMPQ